MRVDKVLLALVAMLQATVVAGGRLPVLSWAPRSDWLNVQELGAKGDGKADDTAAIQAVLAQTVEAEGNYGELLSRRVVYFPTGHYRLTATLEVGKAHGLWLVGCGRQTVLHWDGEANGIMMWSNGNTYARYEGIVWDGRGKAAVGVQHRSMSYYETAIRYQSCGFANLTEHGVAIGLGEPKVATAETWFRHCLFRKCANGVSFLRYNDYDNAFDACHFEACGVGVNSVHGNFYIRGCRFEGSAECDVQQLSPAHASSIRFCVSQGSKQFFRTMIGGHLPMKIQGCFVDHWSAPAAIQLGGRGPTTVFDCVFTNGPDAGGAAIQLANRSGQQALLVTSNNRTARGIEELDRGPDSRVTEIPKGKRGTPLKSPRLTFLDDSPWQCPPVLDVKQDFGAAGDGKADDTEALQAAIDAAAAKADGSLVYLPGGHYRVSRTLRMAGSNYGLTGTGFRSILDWAGPADGTVLAVHQPQDLRLEHFVVRGKPETIRIHQTAEPWPSRVWYDGVFVNGLDACHSGLWLDRLPAEASVLMGQLNGNIRCTESAAAKVLGSLHYYTLTLEGGQSPNTGLTGFMFHKTPATTTRWQCTIIAM